MNFTLITGSTNGIGKALALLYATKGHNLILVARNEGLLAEMKTHIESMYNVEVAVFCCDLGKPEKVKTVFSDIARSYAIDCLINNAGIGIFESVDKLSIETITEQTNINFIAPCLITTLLLPNINQNNGSVINICSVLSFLPNCNSSIYTANKHALLGFSNTLRLENPKLHVLSVHPVTVKTNFFKDGKYLSKMKKVLTAQEVATKIYKSHIKRRRKLYLPWYMSILNLLYGIFPRMIDKLNYRFFSNK